MTSIANTLPSNLAAVVAWAAAAAVWDCRFRRLPNLLTWGGAGMAVVHLLLFRDSVLGACPASAWTAGFGALIVLAPFHRLGWLGAGDIKLMSAIGFLGGVDILLTTFVISSVLTLPFALWLALSRGRRDDHSPRGHARLPQGLFLGLGLMFALLAA